jgi:hypothetical protein
MKTLPPSEASVTPRYITRAGKEENFWVGWKFRDVVVKQTNNVSKKGKFMFQSTGSKRNLQNSVKNHPFQQSPGT